MIGSARDVRGGISALVNVYFGDGLFERWQASYVATHCDGSWPRKAFQALRSWLRVVPAMLAGRVALLHVHIASGASFYRKALFVLPALALRIPFILHMHGGDFARFHGSRTAAGRWLLRLMYARAFAVIALSARWREVIASVVPDARIAVIPNPVQVPPWQSSLVEDPPTVVFLGVIEERKGVHDLLRAWAAVLRQVPAARLVIAGTGDWPAAARLARELGIEQSIEAPGWIGEDRKADLLRRAWAFALPSHFEALPMSVLEAMACGVPIVATTVGGIPEAVGAEAGILLEPRDVQGLAAAITRLLGDSGARTAAGNAARRRAAEAFSAGGVVPQVESLWREALRSPTGLPRHVPRGHA